MGDTQEIDIGNFTLVYRDGDGKQRLIFVSLNLKDKIIIESPIRLNFFCQVVLKAFVNNRLPKDICSITDFLYAQRQSIDNQEFLVLKESTTKIETVLSKIAVMELQSILERFLARIDIFAPPPLFIEIDEIET